MSSIIGHVYRLFAFGLFILATGFCNGLLRNFLQASCRMSFFKRLPLAVVFHLRSSCAFSSLMHYAYVPAGISCMLKLTNWRR